MSKYSAIFNQSVTHRVRGTIPGCKPAVDVFIEVSREAAAAMNLASIPAYAKAIRDEGPWPAKMVFIKNPAPKNVVPWDQYFDVNSVPGYLKNKVF